MNIIEKIILFIKSIFNKQDEVKMLESPKQTENFAQSLKVTTVVEKTNNNFETPVCHGDGLGIQKKMSY